MQGRGPADARSLADRRRGDLGQGRRLPRPQRSQEDRQAVLRLVQPRAHARHDHAVAEVRGDARRARRQGLGHQRSRHEADGRQHRRRPEEARGHGPARQHHRRLHHRQRRRDDHASPTAASRRSRARRARRGRAAIARRASSAGRGTSSRARCSTSCSPRSTGCRRWSRSPAAPRATGSSSRSRPGKYPGIVKTTLDGVEPARLPDGQVARSRRATSSTTSRARRRRRSATRTGRCTTRCRSRAPTGWIMPLTPFHFTLVQNIKRDPFEQAVGRTRRPRWASAARSARPSTAFQYDWNMLPIGQQLWLKRLETLKTFPPLQTPASYNLTQVMEQVEGPRQRRTRATDDVTVLRRASFGSALPSASRLVCCSRPARLRRRARALPTSPSAALAAAAAALRRASSARRCARPVTRARPRPGQGSHHQLAMQPASDVHGARRLRDATLPHAGVDVALLPPRRQVHGAHRRPRRRAPRLRGHAHLRRRAAAAVPGRVSRRALPGARDRLGQPAARGGGQRWFHLYPGRAHRPAAIRCTGPAPPRTGTSCAPIATPPTCASRYDAQTGATRRRFAEISVSCEACHGPGSTHVAWAHEARTHAQRREQRPADRARRAPRRHAGRATRDRQAATQSRRARSEREIEMCARCHSRRGLIHEDNVHGQPLGDDYRVALLDDELYYPDGQIKGEVYEYGSFIQSRMYAEGVTCSDCHDPHSRELRASGDDLCLQCHAAETYATRASTTFTPQGSRGARCVSCHMPATTYMVVDRAPRSQPARPAARSVGEARRAQRVQRLPRRSARSLGGAHGGEMVRPRAVGASAVRRGAGRGGSGAPEAASACWPR